MLEAKRSNSRGFIFSSKFSHVSVDLSQATYPLILTGDYPKKGRQSFEMVMHCLTSCLSLRKTYFDSNDKMLNSTFTIQRIALFWAVPNLTFRSQTMCEYPFTSHGPPFLGAWSTSRRRRRGSRRRLH